MSTAYRTRLRAESGWRGSLPDPEPAPPPPPFCCAPAITFSAWCAQLRSGVESITTDPAVGLRQAKLALLDRWYSVRAAQPKAHRDRVANRAGLPCSYGVFLETLAWLLERERVIAPPALAVPPKPPRRTNAAPVAGGIFLGEIDRERRS